MKPLVIAHGGASDYSDEHGKARLEGVVKAVTIGYEVLEKGGTALDSVTETVAALEDWPALNAGKGSHLTADGNVEMDALIMEGHSLNAGAVGCIENVQNPVKVARLVMEKTKHVLLCGDGAKKFADSEGVPHVPVEDLICDYTRDHLKQVHDGKNFAEAVMQKSSHDTVGAVAIDANGDIVAATSTGGITAKMKGRVGDTPLVGSGGYADNEIGGVSTTGQGEAIMKVCLAYHICSLMNDGKSAQEAVQEGITFLGRRVENGSGGAVAIDKDGKIGIDFNTEKMAWAYKREGVMHRGLRQSDHGHFSKMNFPSSFP